MTPAEIVYLCTIIAIVFFAIGCWCTFTWGDCKCHHQFEEVINTTVKGKPVVVHICKKCGKRKITKV